VQYFVSLLRVLLNFLPNKMNEATRDFKAAVSAEDISPGFIIDDALFMCRGVV
jgi:hypothetical protein